MTDYFGGFIRLLRAEPIQAQACVQTSVALGCAFGSNLSPEQIAAVIAFTASVLAFITRRAVTPNGNVPQV